MLLIIKDRFLPKQWRYAVGFRCIFVSQTFKTNVMKTLKNILVGIALIATTVGVHANDARIIVSEENNVTITEENDLVEVSVLNTQQEMFQLLIISPEGKIVFDGFLGNEASLGKQFDFNSAAAGTYKFKFVTGNGASFSYDVTAGN